MPSDQLENLVKVRQLKPEPPSESRYIVFQCLKHTLDFPNENWRVLDNAHRLSNIAEYEGELDVNEALLESLIRTATKLSDLVSALDNFRT